MYIDVDAYVQYWEDTIVNGVEDIDGTLIPFRVDNHWCPRIRLSDGYVVNWPQGTTAKVHYKVCDAGQYRIHTGIKLIAKWRRYYVPDDFLCHGDTGYGDYIILNINEDGMIENWHTPEILESQWHFFNKEEQDEI